MGNTGIQGFSDRELMAAHFTGFRMWQVLSPQVPLLRSVAFSYEWQQGVNSAVCQTNRKRLVCEQLVDLSVGYAERPHNHANSCYIKDDCGVVAGACGCGFWAYSSHTDWYGGGDGPSGPGGKSGIVRGVVHGFGRMVIGAKGFRAEHAVIAGLVMPPQFSDWFGSGPADPDEAELRRVGHNIASADAEDRLRLAYPSVRFFDTVEDMLAAIPLTPISHLLDDPEAA